MIFKTSFLYYFLAFILAFKCIDLSILHTLRESYLDKLSHSQGPQGKIVYYDYITRLPGNDDALNWFKLSESYKLGGDRANAVAVYRKAVILMDSYPLSARQALLKMYRSDKNDLMQ